MFNSLVQNFVAQSASYLLTQAFVNQLRLQCQQAYYYPYNRDAIHQQITAAIYNAFNSAPAYEHERMASNLLSTLFNYPVQAVQLHLLGPQECARRYPIYAPIIYAVAEILMPGWRLQPPTSPYVPLTGTYGIQPRTEAAAYSQPCSPAASLRYSAPSPRMPHGQPASSPQPAFVAREVPPIQVALPVRPASPFKARKPTLTPSYAPETTVPPAAVPKVAAEAANKGNSLNADFARRAMSLKGAVPGPSKPSYNHPQPSPNAFDLPFDLEAYKAKTSEQKHAFKEQMLRDNVRRDADLNRKMDQMLKSREGQRPGLGQSSGSEIKSPVGKRKDELQRELLEISKQRDEFLSGAVHILHNPGMGAAELGNVVGPLRNRIRNMLGDGIVEQLDAALAEEAKKEKMSGLLDDLSSSRKDEELIEDNNQIEHEVDGAGAAKVGNTGDPKKNGEEARLKRQSIISNREPGCPNKQWSEDDDPAAAAIIAARLRSDRIHSRWIEARQYVDSLTTEERAHPEVALELGRILFAQGWARKAFDAVNVSWSRWRDSWPDQASLNALRLLIAFLDVVCNYKVKEALEIALKVRKIDEDLEDTENLSPVEVAIEIFHYKILQQALAEGFLDEEIFKPPILRRLQTLASWLREDGQICDALSISVFLSDEAASIQEKEGILRQYLDDPSLPPVCKASVCMELADAFVEVKDLSQAQSFLGMAQHAFEQEGHLEGELNIRLKRLTMINRKTATEVNAMLDLADLFADLSSPVSQIRALMSAQSAAFQLFPQCSDFLNVHERIQNLCTQTGNRFVQLQESFSFSAALILRPEHIGKAIETLHWYVDSLSDDLPKSKGQLATMLGQAYVLLGDHEKSLKYAKLAVGAFRHSSNYAAMSDAVWGLANALTQGEGTIDYPEAIQMLEDSVELDAKNSNLAGQVRACETLVTLEGMLAVTDSDGSHRIRRDHWIAERQKIKNQASRRDPIDKARLYLTKKEFNDAVKLAKVALEHYSAENDSESMAACEGLIFSCLYRPFDLYSPRSQDQLLKLAHILVQARKAMAAYESLGPSEIPMPFIIEVSLAFEELGQYVPQRKSALYTEALKYLAAGEAVCEIMRKDLPSFSGLPGLLQKRILVGYKYHREIYTRALRLAAAIGNAEQVWKWTQKVKAQALSDMIASRFVSPDYTPVQDIKDDQAVALLEEESQLLRDLDSASEFDIVSIRMRLDQLRVRMDGRSALSHLLRSRAGAVDLRDLGWIFDSQLSRSIPGNGKIVLVDWAVVDDTIVRLTLDSSLVPEQLQEVTGLVDGLEEFTAKDDLLVLCPSADLHAIPLHALKVGGKILIVRNFVTYTTSLSMLRQCCERANAKARTRPNLDFLRTALFAPIEDESEPIKHRTEPRRIRENVIQLAAEFGSAPNLGPDANREAFRERAQAADIIHFQGHMEYNPNNVLYQALVLNDGRNKEKRRSASGGNEEKMPLSENQRRRKQRHEDLFTVRDIFSLRLDASLTTMIACASGVQDFSPGDEPLGLLAALLYAGSATCVGTLWPVQSADGRFLALEFYQDLCRRMREMQDQAEVQSPLNLAVSFCNAIRLLKADEDPAEGREEWFLPYHWAAFVMHGACFL